MITILHRGGGSLGTPKSDYVICARPLLCILYYVISCIPAYIFFPFPQAVRFKKLGAQSFVFLGGAPVAALGGRRRASVRCHLWADSSVSHPDGGKVGGNSFDLISCSPSLSGYLSQIQGSSSFHGDHYESSWK